MRISLRILGVTILELTADDGTHDETTDYSLAAVAGELRYSEPLDDDALRDTGAHRVGFA